MRNRILLTVALLASLFCVGFAGQTQTHIQFEYKFESAPSEKRANALGGEGWELVAIESQGQGRIVPTYVFRRQL
jgi:hypothetical protein